MSDITTHPHDPFWLERLSPAQRSELERRFEIVQAWEVTKRLAKFKGLLARDAVGPFLLLLEQLGMPISRSTLYNWQRAWRADSTPGLIDRRWIAARVGADDPFIAAARRLYVGPGLLPINVCHALAKEAALKNGWQLRTLREVRQYLKRHVVPTLTRERGAIAGG